MSELNKGIEIATRAALRDHVNTSQVGGDHYKKWGDLQPWDLFHIFKLNPFQANVVKYTIRYRDKGGLEDLKKARHYLDKLIGLVEQGYGE